MIDFNEIPREPHTALYYLSDLLSSEQVRCFDDEGDITERGYLTLSGIAKAINVSAIKSNLPNRIAIQQLCSGFFKDLDSTGVTSDGCFVFSAKIANEALQAKLTERFSFHVEEPLFALEKDEVEQISSLSAEMREIVTVSDVFDKNHKRRLLGRINAIELEIQKPEGRFDVILGGVSDFGDALKKLGKDAKPLVDRINEIRGIAQPKTEEYKGLPAPEEVKNLPAPKDIKVVETNGSSQPLN